MTDATHDRTEWTEWTDTRSDPRAEPIPLPKPVLYDAPVFIADCMTPLGGETVLSLLWKRLERGD